MILWSPARVLLTMLLGGPSAHLICCAIKTLTAQSTAFTIGTPCEILSLFICWIVVTALTFAVTYQALKEEADRVEAEKESVAPVYFKAFEAAFLLELLLHTFHK